MNLQDKILKAIKEGLNTIFNFDDIVDTQLDDIKTEPVKSSAKSVKYRWLYPKLAQLVSEVLNDNEPTLTLDEQNALFENCVKTSIKYQFPNQKKSTILSKHILKTLTKQLTLTGLTHLI